MSMILNMSIYLVAETPCIKCMSVIVPHQEFIAYTGRRVDKIVSIAPFSVTRGTARLIMIPVEMLAAS